MENCRPSWTLHGAWIQLSRERYQIYHAHMKTGRVMRRFYYPTSTSRHSTSTQTSDSDLESDHRISWPQAMTACGGWFNFCDSSSVRWMGLVLLEWEARISGLFWQPEWWVACIQKESHITDCTLSNQTMKIKLLSIPIKANLVENWNLQTPWMLEGSVRELRILIKGSLVANFRYTNFWVAWQE